MKKVICCVLAVIAMLSFAGCSDKSRYRIPKECCVVSVPVGYELWSNKAEIIEKIETPIDGIDRDENKAYYVVSKNAEFSIVNFNSYAFDSHTYGQGKVVTGFSVEENILPYSPTEGNHVTLSCDKNTDILPVYQDFECAGFVVFVADSTNDIWQNVSDLDNFFNSDGSAKEIDNFYYLIQYDESPNSCWKTNLNETSVEDTVYSTTRMIERDFISDGREMAFCVIYRYNETKYFINVPILSNSMAGATIDMGNNYKLIVEFN